MKKEVCFTVTISMMVATHALADRQIPSMLSYIEGEEFQGTQAKVQLVRNAKNTVAYFRDFLGKEYVHGSQGSSFRPHSVQELTRKSVSGRRDT